MTNIELRKMKGIENREDLEDIWETFRVIRTSKEETLRKILKKTKRDIKQITESFGVGLSP